MSLLREIKVIWKKEMLIWAKNPVFAIVRSLMFPLLWIVIFGFAFGGEVNHIPVAVVQEDFGMHANQYVSLLQGEGVLDITTTTNYANAMKMLKERKVYGVIFIPPDFSEGIEKGKNAEIQLSVDETSPQVSNTMLSFISRTSNTFSKQVVMAHLENSDIVDIAMTKKNTLFGRNIEYIDFLAPGVIMMTIVFSAMFSGGLGLVIDRELGTLKMLMAAPISKASIIIGKTSAGVTQSLFSGTAALLIAIAIGVNVKTGFLGFMLMILLMLLAAFGFIGMSIAIGTRITKIEHLMLSMQLVIIPMWFLSGGIYPLEAMPAWMKPLALINPLTYATDAMRTVMIRGIIWKAFAFDVVVMLAFAVLMLMAGSLAFKRTIE